MRHTELGMDIVMKFAEAASEYAQIDKKPVLEGRNLTLFLAPVKQ
jgi:translation initiation factor IF-3